ncbi:MAG: LytTR family DNA-binding domain-containing protein [Bacteroidota bacterium]
MRCLLVDDDALARLILEQYVQRFGGFEIVGTCSSAIEARTFLQSNPVDALFLDVEMPGMTGLELLYLLPEPPATVLFTSKKEYAVDAFEVDVVDYLLKPVPYSRFAQAAERVVRHLSAEPAPSEEDYVYIKTNGKLVKLHLREIAYIEAQGDYVLICTPTEQHLVHGTMKAMERKLPCDDFARVHRSYIVRLDRIDNLDTTSLVVGRTTISIGASYRNDVLARFETF